MPTRRDKPDGLPFNCYEKRGKRTYSICYRDPKTRRAIIWESCPVADAMAVSALRRKVVKRIADLQGGAPAGDSFEALARAWLAAANAEPEGSEERRADTTLAENKREIDKLCAVLGHLRADEITATDGYEYLEAGRAKRRAVKANKEIALASVVFEWGIRKGRVTANPFRGLRKNKSAPSSRLVTPAEMDVAVRAGRKMGGAYLIIALALKTAFLCLRRSVEVRDLQRHQIKDDGIEWVAAKRKRGTAARTGLIEWSPELRATIDEVLAVKRNTGVESWYVFGNLRGGKYTKGGWKKMLANLMDTAEADAVLEAIEFKRFSLQDCRPMGVTAKVARGDSDVQDATLHRDRKMIDQVYDRRAATRATPAA